MKIQNVDYWDRRCYKCAVYNEKEPNECSASVFFLCVQDKLALWWPVIGIATQGIFSSSSILSPLNHGELNSNFLLGIIKREKI